MDYHGLPEDKLPQLRVIASPQEANKLGNIFGGWVMSQVDIAASIPAELRACGPVVTRAVTSFEFRMPVFVGDLVSCYAEIIREGHTSMTIAVEVYAQRHHQGQISCVKVTQAEVVFVAIDKHGNPRSLPEKNSSREDS